MPSNPVVNLNYQSPGAILQPQGLRRYVGLLVLYYAIYAVVMGVLVGLIPKFRQIFADFKLDLSNSTVILLWTSYVCTRFYLWAFLAPFPALLAIGIAKIPSREWKKWIRLVTLLAFFGFVILTIFALFMSMINLIEGITSQSNKP